MTRILFRDQNGRAVAGAVVAITAAPADVAEIGYVTDDDGAIAVPITQGGQYVFTLTAPDGGRLTANTEVTPDGDITATAHASG